MNSPRRRLPWTNENGFSLIDVVVTVAIIVALSVGGFVAYTGLIDNAKKAAVGAAADQVYTAAVVAESDGNSATNNASVKDSYEKSTSEIRVSIAGAGDTLTVTAINVDSPSVRATRGSNANTPPAPVLGPETIARTNFVWNPSMTTNLAHIGKYWNPITSRDTSEFSTGVASLKAVRNGTNSNQGAIWSTTGYTPVNGDKVRAMARVKAPVGLRVTFALKKDLGGGAASVEHIGTGQWVELSTSYTVAPTDPYLQPIVASPASNTLADGTVMFWVDQVYMEVNAVVPGSFFDGSTADQTINDVTYSHRWTGAVNESPSVATYRPEL